jgi:hypothetical protein
MLFLLHNALLALLFLVQIGSNGVQSRNILVKNSLQSFSIKLYNVLEYVDRRLGKFKYLSLEQ